MDRLVGTNEDAGEGVKVWYYGGHSHIIVSYNGTKHPE